MPRPQKCRRICDPPKMKGFRPFGIKACGSTSLVLKFEEYESIKLINYDMLSQEQAAVKMDVSRPTFTRIYNNALKQIAKSFVEGKSLSIEGGNYQLEKEWFRCKKCCKLIQGIENHTRCKNCNVYGENELISLNHTENKDR